jgi:hypothetical protein
MEVIHLQIQKRVRDTFAIHFNTEGNRLGTNCLEIFITRYCRALHYVMKIRHQATCILYFSCHLDLCSETVT